MTLLDYVLEPPSYGWKDGAGNLVKPAPLQILREFFARLNVFKSRKNWLSFMSWLQVVCLVPFFLPVHIQLFQLGVTHRCLFLQHGVHGHAWHSVASSLLYAWSIHIQK